MLPGNSGGVKGCVIHILSLGGGEDQNWDKTRANVRHQVDMDSFPFQWLCLLLLDTTSDYRVFVNTLPSSGQNSPNAALIADLAKCQWMGAI